MPVLTTSVEVDLKLSQKTDTILLGYEIGSADLPHGRKLRVTASGKTIRFTIDTLPGYVDISLQGVAEQAARLLTEAAS